MRVTTNQIYSRPLAMMSKLTAQADKAQTEIATQKKAVGAGDSPVAYLRLQGLKRAATDDSAYGSNIKLAQGVLAQSDSTLEGIGYQIQRAKELALQVNNGTVSVSDRKSVAEELDSIRDALFGLANTKDARGQPIFGGSAGDAAYAKAADGTISFVGTGNPASIPVGEGDSVQPTVKGEQTFAAGSSDMFAVLADLSAALKSGDDLGDAGKDAIAGLSAAGDNVTDARASVGARAARLDLMAEHLVDTNEARESERSSLEDADISTSVMQLQKTLTVLQATQASFSKLSGLSLFDYIR